MNAVLSVDHRVYIKQSESLDKQQDFFVRKNVE